MAKAKKYPALPPIHPTRNGGWSETIAPIMTKPYRLGCCDCGLVHDVEFRIYRVKMTGPDTFRIVGPKVSPETYRVLLRARRNKTYTAVQRRRSKVKLVTKTKKHA